MPNIGDLTIVLKAETAALRKAQQQTNAILGSIDQRMERTAHTARTVLTSGLAGLGAVLGGRAIIEAQMQLDRINMTLQAVNGQTAAVELAFVTAEADRLGLQLGSTAEGYARFVAASKGTELAGQATRDIFTAVAEASARLSLGAEQNEGILRALEQMMSKGTVQAEELRGQLGDRLPGAFQMMARAIGVTSKELSEMLKQGEIASADVLPAFARELENAFGVEDRVDTTVAAFNRLQTALLKIKSEFAQGGFAQAFGKSADFISEHTEEIARSAQAAATVIATSLAGRAFGALGERAKAAVQSLGAVERQNLAIAQSALQAADNQLLQQQAVVNSATDSYNAALHHAEAMAIEEAQLRDLTKANLGGTEATERLRQVKKESAAASRALKIADRQLVTEETRLTAVEVARAEAQTVATASQSRLTAATTLGARASAAAAAAGRGLLTLLGGWTGVALAAAAGIYYLNRALTANKRAAEEAAQGLDNYITQAQRSKMTAVDIAVEKEREAWVALRNEQLKAERLRERLGNLDVPAMSDAEAAWSGNAAAEAQAVLQKELEKTEASIMHASDQWEATKVIVEEARATQDEYNATLGDTTEQLNINTKAVDGIILALRREQAELKATLAGREAEIPVMRTIAQLDDAAAEKKEELAKAEAALAKMTEGKTEDQLKALAGTVSMREKAVEQARAEVDAVEAQRGAAVRLAEVNAQLEQSIDARREAEQKAEESARKAQQALEQRLSDITRLTEEMATPQERYNMRIAELNALMSVLDPATGRAALSMEIYGRAVAAAKKELEEAANQFDRYLKQLQDENAVLGITIQKGEAEGNVLRSLIELRNQGIQVSGQQVEQLRAEHQQIEFNNQVLQEQQRIEQIAQSVKESLITVEQQHLQTLADLDLAMKSGLLTQDQYTAAVERAGLEITHLDDVGRSMADAWSQNMKDMVFEAKSFEDALGGIARSVAEVVYELYVLQPLMRSLFGTDASGGVTGAGGLIGSALMNLRGLGGAPAAGGASGITIENALPKSINTDGGGLLEMARNGALSGRGSGGSAPVNVTVEMPPAQIINKSSGSQVSQRTVTGADGRKQLQIMVEDAVDGAFARGRFDRRMADFGASREGKG